MITNDIEDNCMKGESSPGQIVETVGNEYCQLKYT